MTKKVLLLSSMLLLGLALSGGCDSGSSGTGGENEGKSPSGNSGQSSNLSGSITVDGSSTVEPITLKAKEMFNAIHKNVNVAVSGKGTGDGFSSIGKREADIADASRPVKAKELKTCQDAGVNFYEIPVAYDGLTVVVNKENDFVKELTVEQLSKIFREDLAAKTWKDVNPDWPDEAITIYIPGTGSGTHDYFVEVIGKDEGKALRSDEKTTLSEDDKQLVRGVKGDKNAIGFFGYSYYEPEKDSLNAVKIVNEKGVAVAPSMETIVSGEYSPFSRPLFIYVNEESYKRTEVAEFVNFYLENIEEIVKKATYVPLPNEIYEAAFERLEAGTSGLGTHYLDADGNKRDGTIREIYQSENLRK